MNSSGAVSAELGLSLILPDDETIVPLTASFHYFKDDPYAVRLDLHVGLDEPVAWVFARELLTAGMEREHGDGDVRVWPSVCSRTGLPAMVLNIELSSPNGAAVFEAPIREVGAFLVRAHDLVPAGREGDHVDLDRELAGLLRQAS